MDKVKSIAYASWAFIKVHKITSGVVLAAALAVLFFATRGPAAVEYDFIAVAYGTVAQEVEVTGRVVPAHAAELAVQTGGKVASIGTAVGQRVSAGQALLSVSQSDLSVRLARQQAALAQAQLELGKAEQNISAGDDLTGAYEDGFNAVADAFLDLPAALTALDDLLGHDYLSQSRVRTYGEKAVEFKRDATDAYYAAKDAYDDTLSAYKSASRGSESEVIESLILDTYDTTRIVADAVKITNNLVDYAEDKISGAPPAQLAEDQDSLDLHTAHTSGHLSALLAAKDAIKDSKTGITDEGSDLQSLQLSVRQAELDLEDTQVQMEQRIIRAPIAGTITDIRAEVGETISGGAPVISLISASRYQVEANLPESDIAKVRVGAPATITLDAYGSDDVFEATVVSVNPAEDLVDGVATYKVVLEFASADERLKSGMTADITILGERKEGVLSVPQRAVITRGATKFVQVLRGEEAVDIPVETGLRGTDGTVEITSGLSVGDQVIVFSPQ